MIARVDKFLWCVRLYKTRAIAVDALKRGRVTLNGAQVKSSREVKAGDVVAVKVGAAQRSFEVLQLPRSRMGAKLVPEYLREVTPKDQLEMIEIARLAAQMNRARGTGRPTKKERRDIEAYFGEGDIEFGTGFEDIDFESGEDGDDLGDGLGDDDSDE